MQWKATSPVLFLLLLGQLLEAQEKPIGTWTDHLPYGSALSLATGGGQLWCSTPYSVFSLDQSYNSITRWSKVNGLHETGVRCISWNETIGGLVIAYNNNNIDIILGQTVENINDILNSSVPGIGHINSIFCMGDNAYLSCGLGIILADIRRLQISDTYIIGANGQKTEVFAVTQSGNNLYAATEEGLKEFSSSRGNPSDFRNWDLLSGSNGLPVGPSEDVTQINNQLLAQVGDSVFVFSNGSWIPFYSSGWTIENMTPAGDQILIAESHLDSGRITVLTGAGAINSRIHDEWYTGHIRQALPDGTDYWLADSLAGLSRFDGSSFTPYVPSSPRFPAIGEATDRNGIYLAASTSLSPDWEPASRPGGLCRYEKGNWTNYFAREVPALDTLPDIIAAAIDPSDGTAWAGSFGGGLLQLGTGGKVTVYKQNSFIGPDLSSGGAYRIGGLCMGVGGALWISNYGAAQPLVLREADGSTYSFPLPFPVAGNALGALTTDDLNQVWVIAARGQGLLCFNYNNSPGNPSDDQWKWYRSGSGNGNLPDNTVLCLAKDKNDFIWVGSTQGIGIIQCPPDVFSASGCETLLPVVQQDNFAGYLFRDEVVQTIAVDGADRKWVGTHNGAWLISPDAEKTIYHFTTANSPLPSNDVRSISIDGKSGDVFFATPLGTCSFRGTATEAGPGNSQILVFPNPVPPGYSGTIAIRGLAENAIVKIAEPDGRLVYETRALGGQAVWDGRNYRGQTVARGVYLVLIRDERGQEKAVTKIVFVKR